MAIKVLPSELCDQIAAGEVIQNPASLLKELIENALDAQATIISITLEHAGFSKIVVEDNGFGISKEDLPLAPKRYATSKISNFEDLYAISTMGFRGEALASIFSVAKVTLESKPKEQDYAYKITNDNLHPQKTALENGTRITIEDLFYNTPARKKYLRSQQLEMRSIVEMIKSIAIIHPHLQLKVVHNSKIVFDKVYSNSIKQSSYSILEIGFSSYQEFENSTFEITSSTPQCIISGILLNPNELNYATKKHIRVYVNSRPISSQLINKAILAGIGTNIHSGRYPLCILNIIIDPQLIDVNVHPAKLEIKFEQEHLIFDAVFHAIKKVFEEQLAFKSIESKKSTKDLNLIPKKIEKSYTEEVSKDNLNKVVNTQQKYKEQTQEVYNSKDTSQKNKNEGSSCVKSYFNKERQQELQSVQEPSSIEIFNENSIHNKKSQENQLQEKPKGPLFEYLQEYRVVGQVNKTFIIVETPKEMILLDQHVIEEKFYFELFKSNFSQSTVKYQQLLEPKIIRLSLDQYTVFLQIKMYLEKLGFDIDSLQEKEIIIRACPLDLRGNLISYTIIVELLDSLENEDLAVLQESEIPQKMLDTISSLACKSSIRAGEELTSSQMYELVEKVRELKEPFNCPHGRPILVKYSYKELYKMFGRV